AMSASGGTTAGAISFAVTGDSTACSILTSGPDTGKLAITSGTGVCKITATRAGNADYNDVTSAAHAVTVSKANQAALTVDSPSAGTFGDHLAMSASGGTTPGAISF